MPYWRMCGRFTLTKRPASLGKERERPIDYPLQQDGEPLPFEKRFNIAPTQASLVIRKDAQNEGFYASRLRWGLVPSWSKSGTTQAPLINARSETVDEKPAFKAAFQRRRCLVPADGYYEWKRLRHGSQPYYFQLRSKALFYMAGIWETWWDDSGQAISSFAILTTRANPLAAKVHDRMPVIFLGDTAAQWLEEPVERFNDEQRFALFSAIDEESMQCRPVNPIVNNNQRDEPQCIEPPPELSVAQLDMGF